MALNPIDEKHALQIQAGTLGRNSGHDFEYKIARQINEFRYPLLVIDLGASHVLNGNPAAILLNYVGRRIGIKTFTSASAISTGALATSEAGKQWLSINGAHVSRCKSDLVLTLSGECGPPHTVGVSTKQCNNRKPTNAQLYFTTARGFATLLQNNGIPVSDTAINALRQFCGEPGFRPSDDSLLRVNRTTDPRRFFWEEIAREGREEWENIFIVYQDRISRLLFQKAYLDDLFIPEYLLHKTTRSETWDRTEVAIYSVEELIQMSRAYHLFYTKEYSVRKGSHKDPPGVKHLAPRFGIIQMQRGGQRQHPEQLQFNLEAGYFYNLRSVR